MTGQTRWERLKRTPHLELLTSGAIVLSNAVIAAQPRIVSDILFLEGMTLSVFGALVTGRFSGAVALPSFVKERNDIQAQRNSETRQGYLKSLLKKKTGRRIMIVGVILVAAAVLIGEAARLVKH